MTETKYQPHYSRSLALVIGIDKYESVPPLSTAVRGAKAIAEILKKELGFDEVNGLYDRRATRDGILKQIERFSKTDPDDRVLIYFAGHGMSTTTVAGQKVGALVPYGGTSGELFRAIEMDFLIDRSKYIPAKHILFVLDACFSGLAITRSGEGSDSPLEDLMTRRCIQGIAAGQEDQEVADTYGPDNHSIFTSLFIQRLKQKGGLLTGGEMGLYLQREVAAHTHSRQTPHYNHLLGSQGGDFVFWADDSLPRDLPQALRTAILSPQPYVRKGAVDELATLSGGDLGNSVLKTLEQLKTDSDKSVASKAVTTLNEIKDAKYLASLRSELRSTQSFPQTYTNFPKTITITSSSSIDDQVTITANIALLLAQKGMRVGVADGNVGSPRVHLPFDFELSAYQHTFTTFLKGKCEAEEAAYNVTKSVSIKLQGEIWLIPSGADENVARYGFDINLMNKGLHVLCKNLNLDTLLICRHHELISAYGEEDLLFWAISDALVIITDCNDLRRSAAYTTRVAVDIDIANSLDVRCTTLLLTRANTTRFSIQELMEEVEEKLEKRIIAYLPDYALGHFSDIFAPEYRDNAHVAALYERIAYSLWVAYGSNAKKPGGGTNNS